MHLSIHGEIDTAEEILRQVGDASEVQLRIDCPGGNSFAAMEAYEVLRERETHVLVTGRLYSSALFLAMAAKSIRAYPTARFLVHAPCNHVCGTADVLACESKFLRKLTDRIAAAIALRCRQPIETVNEWLSTDTYFDAEQAKAVGLVDEIIPAPTPSPEVSDVPAVDGEPGFTASERLLFDFLRALDKIETHDRQRLQKELGVHFTYSVKEI